MEKYYEFHWLDGEVSYLKGKTEEDACMKAGVGFGGLKVIDYISEAKELPLVNKEIRYIYLDKDEQILNRDTLFVENVMKHINNHENDFEIHIANHIWKCRAEIKPFEIVLTEYI